MSSCSSIDRLVTPYVDDELVHADRHLVEQHIGVCAPCRSHVAAEQVVRDLLRERQPAFRADSAPAALRARCAGLVAPTARATRDTAIGARPPTLVGPGSRPAVWRTRAAPLAAAASLVLVVGGAFFYQATKGSSRLMAAELAADHMKCFAMNAVLGTHQSPETVQSSMASGFAWDKIGRAHV